MYSIKAAMTRDRYQTRLAKFLEFIGTVQCGTTLEGELEPLLKRERRTAFGHQRIF
jgi:hypothetical protein